MINQISSSEFIEKKFKELPATIQDLILSADWKNWVGNISKKNHLNLDQAATLESEVLFFMLGASSTIDMRKTLTREMNLSETAATQVMTDINDQIIDRLKQTLIEETVDKLGMEKEIPFNDSKPIYDSLSNTIEHRDQILADIEKHAALPKDKPVGVYTPKPKVEPILDSLPKENLPSLSTFATPKPIVPPSPTPSPSTSPISTSVPIPKPNPQAPSIMDNKFAGTVKTGVSEQKVSLEPAKTETSKPQEKISAPKTYSVDPYRELPQ